MAFSDLLTYELTDFLMFAPGTYVRMIERYNEAFWPGHLMIVFSALVSGAWLHARKDARLVLLTLAAAWLMVAYSFFMLRYAAIMTAAPTFAGMFIVQAALFVGLALKPSLIPFDGTPRMRRLIGLALVGVSFLLYPFTAYLAGRGLMAGEFPGLMPDPTALGTLGVCLVARRAPWWLYAIPVVWAVIGTLTLIAMETPDWWQLMLLLLIGLATLTIHRLTFREAPP